jgi:hypothetical protein
MDEEAKVIDFAGFYASKGKKGESANWNAFLQDDETSLLSRPTETKPVVQYVKRTNGVHLTKQNQLFKYLPFAYFLLTA